jgi:hypothetical protein
VRKGEPKRGGKKEWFEAVKEKGEEEITEIGMRKGESMNWEMKKKYWLGRF